MTPQSATHRGGRSRWQIGNIYRPPEGYRVHRFDLYRATSMQARRVVETGTPTAAITDAPGSGRPKIDDPGSEGFSVTRLR